MRMQEWGRFFYFEGILCGVCVGEGKGGGWWLIQDTAWCVQKMRVGMGVRGWRDTVWCVHKRMR